MNHVVPHVVRKVMNQSVPFFLAAQAVVQTVDLTDEKIVSVANHGIDGIGFFVDANQVDHSVEGAFPVKGAA